MADIRRGGIQAVVVYKLDRISRSIVDFSNMMETFQSYGVDFISSTEKFDTSTPIGRAMLNLCAVFAQLERETIQKQVKDAYRSRKPKRGFIWVEECLMAFVWNRRVSTGSLPDNTSQ